MATIEVAKIVSNITNARDLSNLIIIEHQQRMNKTV